MRPSPTSRSAFDSRLAIFEYSRCASNTADDYQPITGNIAFIGNRPPDLIPGTKSQPVKVVTESRRPGPLLFEGKEQPPWLNTEGSCRNPPIGCTRCYCRKVNADCYLRKCCGACKCKYHRLSGTRCIWGVSGLRNQRVFRAP